MGVGVRGTSAQRVHTPCWWCSAPAGQPAVHDKMLPPSSSDGKCTRWASGRPACMWMLPLVSSAGMHLHYMLSYPCALPAVVPAPGRMLSERQVTGCDDDGCAALQQHPRHLIADAAAEKE